MATRSAKRPELAIRALRSRRIIKLLILVEKRPIEAAYCRARPRYPNVFRSTIFASRTHTFLGNRSELGDCRPHQLKRRVNIERFPTWSSRAVWCSRSTPSPNYNSRSASGCVDVPFSVPPVADAVRCPRREISDSAKPPANVVGLQFEHRA